VSDDFREPKLIEDVSVTKCFLNGTGQLKKPRYRGETLDFFQTREVNGNTIYEFIADLVAGDNSIRIKGTSSAARPTFAKDLANQFNDGDWVKLSGFLNEWVKDGIPRRNGRINKLEKLNGKPENPGFASVLQGKIVDFEVEDSKLTVHIGMPKFKSEEEDVFEVWGVTSDLGVKWLINNKISTSDYISLESVPIYRNFRNDNGEWETKNFSLIKTVYAYAKGNGEQKQEEQKEEEFQGFDLNNLPF
jgi:hypothetical protein